MEEIANVKLLIEKWRRLFLFSSWNEEKRAEAEPLAYL